MGINSSKLSVHYNDHPFVVDKNLNNLGSTYLKSGDFLANMKFSHNDNTISSSSDDENEITTTEIGRRKTSVMRKNKHSPSSSLALSKNFTLLEKIGQGEFGSVCHTMF